MNLLQQKLKPPPIPPRYRQAWENEKTKGIPMPRGLKYNHRFERRTLSSRDVARIIGNDLYQRVTGEELHHIFFVEPQPGNPEAREGRYLF